VIPWLGEGLKNQLNKLKSLKNETHKHEYTENGERRIDKKAPNNAASKKSTPKKWKFYTVHGIDDPGACRPAHFVTEGLSDARDIEFRQYHNFRRSAGARVKILFVDIQPARLQLLTGISTRR
jgi:hypothetical protein